MRYFFQRGEGFAAADSEATLFRFETGAAARPVAGPLYSCSWVGSVPTVTFLHQEGPLRIALSKIDANTYFFSHAAFGRIYLVKTPWHLALPRIFPSDGVTMSFQGWDRGQWFDGIYSRQVGGEIVDLILPGTSFQVRWGETSLALIGVEEWFHDVQYSAHKQSLIRAVQIKWGSQIAAETALEMGQGTDDEILSLLLFRLAFPLAKFVTVPAHEGLKRLAQNLNVLPKQAIAPRVPRLLMAINWGPPQAVHDLLQWQLHKSPFIPAKLWARRAT